MSLLNKTNTTANASLIAVAKSKLGKKEKKGHHKNLDSDSLSYKCFDEKGDVIDTEYKVIEDERENTN